MMYELFTFLVVIAQNRPLVSNDFYVHGIEPEALTAQDHDHHCARVAIPATKLEHECYSRGNVRPEQLSSAQ